MSVRDGESKIVRSRLARRILQRGTFRVRELPASWRQAVSFPRLVGGGTGGRVRLPAGPTPW